MFALRATSAIDASIRRFFHDFVRVCGGGRGHVLFFRHSTLDWVTSLAAANRKQHLAKIEHKNRVAFGIDMERQSSLWRLVVISFSQESARSEDSASPL